MANTPPNQPTPDKNPRDANYRVSDSGQPAKGDSSPKPQYFFCPTCGLKLKFADHPKFCFDCGTAFALDIHGDVLVDDAQKAYIRPPSATQPYRSSPNIILNVSNAATADGQAQRSPYVPVPSDMYFHQGRWRKRHSWNIGAGILLPLLTYLGILIVSAVILAIVMFSTGNLEIGGITSTLINAISIFFLIIPLLWVQRYSQEKLTLKQRLSHIGLDFDKYKGKRLAREIILGIFLGFLGVLVVFGLQAVGAYLVQWLFNIDINIIMDSDQMAAFDITPQSLGELILFVLTMVLFIGIPEEAMFRGFVQKSFESKLTKPAALLLTAVFFAFYHIYPYVLNGPAFFFLSLSYLGLSIFLGLIRNWRGDILAAAIMHMVYNSTQMIVVYIIIN